jgi:hypothetical protein
VSDGRRGAGVTGATPDDAPGPRDWRSWTVGTRVVVRRTLPEGGWTDVLGDLLEVGPEGVLVATRRGPVRVPADEIALGKPVPPAPVRRAPRGPSGVSPPARR